MFVRIPEPELMEDELQAVAYARADFSAPHDEFVRQFSRLFAGIAIDGSVLDLGCGPADVTVRFARAFERARMHGVDGSSAMLAEARTRVAAEDLGERVALELARVPHDPLPRRFYEAVISNGVLHHFADPVDFWHAIAAGALPGAPIFVVDLRRPESEAQASALVSLHAAGAPEVLRRDYHASLRAAYTPDEVEAQLSRSGLGHLAVSVISDRHLRVAGRR